MCQNSHFCRLHTHVPTYYKTGYTQGSLKGRSDKQNVSVSRKNAKYVHFSKHHSVVRMAEGRMPSFSCHCGIHSAYEVSC